MKNEEDDTWRKKGHAHKVKHDDMCPCCMGTGIMDDGSTCVLCGGRGYYKA